MSAIETDAIESDTPSTPGDVVMVIGSVTGDILTLAGDDSVTLAAGSNAGGEVDLGAGDDTLNLGTDMFMGLTGGAGDDTLTISATGLNIAASGGDADAISGFETLTIAMGGNTLTGAHVGLTAANFNAGETILDGDLTATTTTIATEELVSTSLMER